MNNAKRVLAGLFLFVQAMAGAWATDISTLPIEAIAKVKPNIIFGFDDSGSMKYEVLMGGTQGVARFESDTYQYLFPGSGTIVPTVDGAAQFRSSDYNPLYYNPDVTYSRWVKNTATSSTSTVRYAAAVATAAKYDPMSTCTSGTTCLLDLTGFKAGGTQTITTPTTTSYTVSAAGTVISSAGTVTGTVTYDCSNYSTTIQYSSGNKTNKAFSKKTNCTGATTQFTFSKDYKVQKGQSWSVRQTTDATTTVTLPNWYWATYYKKVSADCGSACVPAPDAGFWLQKVVIAAGTDEMQNFANWFQYARSRRLLMAYSMSNVLSSMTGIRAGIIPFNSAVTFQMYDLDTAADTDALLNIIYATKSTSATPTHANLKAIGDRFNTPATDANAPIQFACQKNAAFVLTDGYANDSAITPPTYTSSSFGSNVAPYSTTYKGSLADMALYLYIHRLRTDLDAGQVPLDTYTTAGGADRNPDLHMNTYALTLGADGLEFQANADPYSDPPAWATPVSNTATMIDDLWHATINGRGLMFSADNVNTLIVSVQNAMLDIILRAGSQSAIAVANVNMTQANNSAYVASFNSNGWFGDVQKYTVSLTDGSVDTTSSIWSARVQLEAVVAPADNRIISTWNGGFRSSAALTSINPELTPNVVNYLRGDRSNEGVVSGTFRTRTWLFGDAVNAEPVVIDNGTVTVVYQAGNDGMLHAIDAVTGNELWAYVPKSVLGTISLLSHQDYTHNYLVDGTPVAGSVGSQIVLVGGLGVGGTGYYAIDITNPVFASEAALADKVLWEFPVTAADKANMGTSHGKAIFITTKAYGQVVVLTSGYNNGTSGTGGDGKGHIWFLDPLTGAVKKELVTPDVTPDGTGAAANNGSATAPMGLASFSAFAVNPKIDITATALYGGDELGNVWRVKVDGDVSSAWSVTKLAALKSSAGAIQPITTAPELTLDADQSSAIVYLGTGRLLGASDMTSALFNSFYAIKDSGKATVLSRTSSTSSVLDWLPKFVSQDATTNRLITDPCVDTTAAGVAYCTAYKAASSPGNAPAPFDFSKSFGWYVDFPTSGEREVGDSAFALGQITWTTNVLSPNSCSASSYIYTLDKNGNEVRGSNTAATGGLVGGRLIGAFTVSRPVIVRLPNGKVVSIFHKSTGDVTTTAFSSANRPPRAVSWKEIMRTVK